MSFDDRFELGQLLRDDGIQTFSVRDKAGAAKDKSSGQDLLVHFLTNPAEASELSASLNRLPERERQRIVDRGERAGIAYVVTGALPAQGGGQAGFREWLAENGRDPHPLDAAGAWKVILPQRNVDEQFLSLFPTGERVQAQPPEPAPPASAEPMGEFTRLFQAVPPAPAPGAAPPAGPAQPGEFTRMFQAPSAAPQAPSPAGPKQAEGRGEFTRFFEAQVHESRIAPQPFPAPVQSNPGAPKQGEFTKVFGRGEIRTPPNPPEQPPHPPEPPPPAPVPPPPARLFDAPPAVPRGPGEYTRLFSATPALTLGQGPPETPPLAPASAPRAASSSSPASRWPLILGISAIVVLLAAVIFFLVSRAK